MNTIIMCAVKTIVISIVVVLSTACGQHYNYVKDFPEKRNLSYDTVPYNAAEINLLLINPMSGGFKVGELLKSEHHFALLDNDLNEIVRFGRNGRGPEEFINARFVGMTEISDDSLSLLIRDWTKGRLYSTSVNIHDGNTHSSLLREYPTSMRAIYPLDNGTFLCSNEANRYFFDNNGTTIYLEGWGEDINEALENSDIYIPDNQTSEFFSRDGSRLLIYSVSYPILYLHSMKDGALLNKTYVQMRPEDFPDKGYCPVYFGGGGYVGDHIVLLLCNDSNESSQILIFDKNLKPFVSYDVPYVNTMDIDSDTGTGFSLDYENELIYMFDLSQWL